MTSFNPLEDLAAIIRSTRPENVISRIDNTLLRQDVGVKELKRFCKTAMEYGFAACYVPPWFVEEAATLLAGSSVAVGSVVGFPLGFTHPRAKVKEAEALMEAGVDEVDMVMNLSAFKSGLLELVKEEIGSIADIVHGMGGVLKVIIETGFLNDEEKILAAKLVADSGGDYVKTCTGFTRGAATIHDVLLIKEAVGGQCKVKASGGIRHYVDAAVLVAAGADRIGTSSGITIADEAELFRR